MRLRLEGIPEEHQQVDETFRNLGTDLLVAANGTGKEPVYVQAEFVLQHRAGGTGGIQHVLGQRKAVEVRRAELPLT